MEPSIPFHTLVNLVDAEDIANDKIRTQDLTLGINNSTKQLPLKLLTHPHKNNLSLLNLKTQTTKPNLHIKNTALFVTEQITPSLHVSKNSVMMQINETLMLDQSHHKSLLYSTFVLHLMIEQKPMITDTEAEAIHVTTLITKIIHKTDIVLHHEIDLVMTKVRLLQVL